MLLASAELFCLFLCAFLPGLILVDLLKPKVEIIGGFVFSIAFSLLLNHFVVTGLTALGLYQAGLMRIYAAACVATLVAAGVIGWQRRRRPAETIAERRFLSVIEAFWLAVGCVLIGIALIKVAWHAGHDFGAVFNLWDDIVSWNRWALDFAAGRMPRFTSQYPQLLPSIWSIFYVESGSTDLQIFIKCFMAWLPVLQVVVFVAMWREERQLTYALGAILAAGLLGRADFYAVSAYAEIPAGTLAFVSFYAAWLSARREGREADKIAWIGAAIVATATLTKQAGGLFLFTYPLFLLGVSAKSPERRRRVLVSFAIALGLALPWYIYREHLILSGREASNLHYLTSTIHKNLGFLQRFWVSTGYAREWLDGYISLPRGYHTSLWNISIAATIFALVSRFGRLVLLSTVVPYFLLYAFFFGYDERNLMAIAPFLAWSDAIGIANACGLLGLAISRLDFPGLQAITACGRRPAGLTVARAGRESPSLPLLLAPPLVAMLCLTLSVANWAGGWPSQSFLNQAQAKALLDVGVNNGGNPAANRALVSYLESHPAAGLVATNFMPVNAIPIVAEHYLFARMNGESDLDLLLANPKADLVFDVGEDYEMSQEGRAALDAGEHDGRLSRVASGPGWRLLQIVR